MTAVAQGRKELLLAAGQRGLLAHEAPQETGGRTGHPRGMIAQGALMAVARQVQRRVDWCRQQVTEAERTLEDLVGGGREILECQRADGSFAFDPRGRHCVKDGFHVAATCLKPTGLAGDTALDTAIQPVVELLELARTAGETALRETARCALYH